MKTLQAMLVALVTLFTLANPTQAASVWVEGDLTSQYLGFDSGAVFYDNLVYQTSVNVELENVWVFDKLGFAGWASTSFDKRWGNNFGDEVDAIIWADKEIGGFNLNFYLAYFWEPIAGFADVVYPRLKVSREFGDWTIGVQAGCYMMIDGSEGGWLFGPYVSREFEINEKLSIPMTVKVLRDDGAFGLQDCYVGQLQLGLNWQATEDTSVRLYGKLYSRMGDSSADDTESLWGVGFTKNF